jgi:hypothetical protein
MLTILIQKEKHKNLNYNLLFSSSSSSYLLALFVRIFRKTLANLVKLYTRKNSKKPPIFFEKKRQNLWEKQTLACEGKTREGCTFNLVPHFQEYSSLRMSSFLGCKGKTMEGCSFH